MPTLFGRRYMRDAVPRTEKVIGAVCLLIAAGAVFLFVRDARTPKSPFFSVDPALHPAAVPVEIKVARALLPEATAPGWARAEPVEAVEPDGIERSMPGEARRFIESGARRMYQGRYLNRADPRQQLAVRVFDMGTAQAAAGVFDAARPKDAVGEPVGVRGWRSENGTVGFAAGRWFTLVSSTNLAADASLNPRLLAREVADRQVAYDAQAEIADADRPGQSSISAQPAPSAALLPTVPGGEWSAPDPVATYNPGNLWEKINGRAEQYLAFDFERLVFGTYRLATRPAAAVDVYVYRMGEPVKAFGIFQAERPEHPQKIDLGQDGYRGAGSVFFIKGRHYVQIIAGEGAGVSDAQLMSLAKAVEPSLPDEGGGIWAEQMLPREGRVEGSFAYHARTAFNLDFLDDVFAADYEAGSQRLTLFVHRAADAEAAGRLMEQYRDYIGKLGRVTADESLAEGRILTGDFGEEFDVVFTRGRYFGGATAASDAAAARARALALRDSVPAE